MRAKIISFEGIDGSGKSSILKEVTERLLEQGKRVLVLQEPGTTELGLELRKLLKSDLAISPLAEVFLFMASRADMVKQSIELVMNQYDYILIDRYIDSTIAYQGYGVGHSLIDLDDLNDLSIGAYQPDKTILIDAPMDIAAMRRIERGDTVDKFDTDFEFAERVYHGYQMLKKQYPERITPIENIDFNQAVNDVLITIQNLDKQV